MFLRTTWLNFYLWETNNLIQKATDLPLFWIIYHSMSTDVGFKNLILLFSVKQTQYFPQREVIGQNIRLLYPAKALHIWHWLWWLSVLLSPGLSSWQRQMPTSPSWPNPHSVTHQRKPHVEKAIAEVKEDTKLWSPWLHQSKWWIELTGGCKGLVAHNPPPLPSPCQSITILDIRYSNGQVSLVKSWSNKHTCTKSFAKVLTCHQKSGFATPRWPILSQCLGFPYSQKIKCSFKPPPPTSRAPTYVYCHWTEIHKY